MKEKLSTEEKLMSLLSHISILIPNIGIMAPIMIWITQKEKSQFTRFNALQAIFFQLVFLALIMISVIIGMILMFVSLPGIISSPNDVPGTLFWVSMGVMNLYLPLGVIFSIVGIVASVKSFKGRIFKYAIIGRIIKSKVYK
jgi:uncharacterized Tic20 family protein